MDDILKEIDFIQLQRAELRAAIASQSKVVKRETQKLLEMRSKESCLQSKALNLRDGLAATLPG
jgi:hypothetical protein